VASNDVTRVGSPEQPSAHDASLGAVIGPGQQPRVSTERPVDDHTEVGVGTVVRGRFELQSMLGAGGMGVVYKAVDRLHKEMQDRDPYVAIKILNTDLERHPSALMALQRETRKAQLLAHENIINVHSFDRDGSIVYMTMELLDGQSLRSLVADHSSTGLPSREAVPMICSMAKALAYAHDNDIVHADFKPANVFLTRKKQIKVLDFGLARAAPEMSRLDGGQSLDSSPPLGGMTPAYASPEMLEGEEPTPADDVFALAIVAYELLTGRHPFDYEVANEADLAAVRATPLPGLSRSRRRALRRALGERNSRHKNAGEFLKEFDGLSKIKRVVQAGVAAAATLPVAMFLISLQNDELTPTIAFEDLTPEVKAQFERAVSEGQTALTFGDAGINDALVFFSSANELHRNNPRALRGLETVADRFLASLPRADAATRTEVFEVLYCNDYLSRYPPVATVCDDLLGTTQCGSIAQRCRATLTE